MKNKIIFTQDVLGEREWLRSTFPDYNNLETHSSGLWNVDFPDLSTENNLYEMSFRDPTNYNQIENSSITKIKSFYTDDYSTVLFDNKNWVYSTSFVSTANYQPWEDKPKFWVLHLARTGTVFVESLLQKHRIKHRRHVGAESDSQLISVYQECKNNPDINFVFVYRDAMWETFTSTVLAKTNGYHHQTGFDWSSAAPVTITHDHMLDFYSVVVFTFNFWCNLRSMLPSHSFTVINGSEAFVKYRQFTNHGPVVYDKTKLITNYLDAKKQWYLFFDRRLQNIVQNTISHLSKMHCKKDLDYLF